MATPAAQRVAMASGAVLVLIVLACRSAPRCGCSFVAHHGPDDQNISGVRARGRQAIPVVGVDGTPIGPGLRGAYLLGADSNGRDLFVRVLYGGRTSLLVGIASALLCVALALAARARRRHARRDVRCADLPLARPDLVVPGLPARGRARRPRSRSAGSSSGLARLVDVDLDPDRDHRRRLRALRRAADPRPGARRCGARSSSRPRSPTARGSLRVMARELLPNVMSVGADLLHADRRQQHPDRGGALVPRRRRAAAHARRGATSSSRATRRS